MNIDNKLSIVTMNKYKYEEAREVLSRFGIDALWVRYEPKEIQSDSLLDIIIWKGYDASRVVDYPFVVEDTGLFIKELNGFPGPYSSYVFKTIGLNGILKLMREVEDRRALFKSYCLLYLGDNIFKVFNVSVRGTISKMPRGNKGFGYDPIFIPQGFNKTFGEMDINVKNSISHRGKLFNIVGDYLHKLRKGEKWYKVR